MKFHEPEMSFVATEDSMMLSQEIVQKSLCLTQPFPQNMNAKIKSMNLPSFDPVQLSVSLDLIENVEIFPLPAEEENSQKLESKSKETAPSDEESPPLAEEKSKENIKSKNSKTKQLQSMSKSRKSSKS